jgi:hypothetical protein
MAWALHRRIGLQHFQYFPALLRHEAAVQHDRALRVGWAAVRLPARQPGLRQPGHGPHERRRLVPSGERHPVRGLDCRRELAARTVREPHQRL